MFELMIKSVKDYECLLAEEGIKIIFKFSELCPVSKNAEDNFTEWRKKNIDRMDITIGWIDVIEYKELSGMIADNHGIKHESPQIIAFDYENKVIFSASHFGITEERIAEELLKYPEK